MQGRIVFLLEEPSMETLLEGLLPRLFPGMEAGSHFLCIKHEGKSDLDRSIPRKLKAWHYPNDRFVILRDNDSAICTDIKARITKICMEAGRPDTLIRLVCQELESWYIGDLQALAVAFCDERLASPATRKRFSTPDAWQKPSVELARMIPTFQKGSAARVMAESLTIDGNISPSFHAFVTGIRRVASELGYGAAS